MTSKAQAKQAYENLAINWLCDERDNYDAEDPDEIPTAELKDSNYKDLRVLQDYYNEEDEPTKEVTLCGLNEDQVQKFKQSYLSLYELVFVGGTSCAAPDWFTSRLQCCLECHTWYDIDDMGHDDDDMSEGYKCKECYKEDEEGGAEIDIYDSCKSCGLRIGAHSLDESLSCDLLTKAQFDEVKKSRYS